MNGICFNQVTFLKALNNNFTTKLLSISFNRICFNKVIFVKNNGIQLNKVTCQSNFAQLYQKVNQGNPALHSQQKYCPTSEPEILVIFFYYGIYFSKVTCQCNFAQLLQGSPALHAQQKYCPTAKPEIFVDYKI